MRFRERLSDAAYIEAVASMFATAMPTAIMSALFVGTGALVLLRVSDSLLGIVVPVGILLSLARLAASIRLRALFADTTLAIARVRVIERWFGALYLGFAVLLGLFAARAFLLMPASFGMLIVALTMGYGAGVASTIALRPLIALPSMIVATVPLIAAALWQQGADSLALGMMLAAFLAGGIRSTLVRYAHSIDNIAMRQTFFALARRDHLTGLPNRLALAERFADARRAEPVAIHCIDLDGFKPINDRFGHPAGDAVLVAVAAKLSSLLGPGDFAARLGGDEFVLVHDVAGEAEVTAMRDCLAATIGGIYQIRDSAVLVGASVGSAMMTDGETIVIGLARADDMLCAAKQRIAPQPEMLAAPSPADRRKRRTTA